MLSVLNDHWVKFSSVSFKANLFLCNKYLNWISSLGSKFFDKLVNVRSWYVETDFTYSDNIISPYLFEQNQFVIISLKFFLIFYVYHVIYCRDLRRDDATLHAHYMASNIFVTILANNLIFSFLIFIKMFSLLYLTSICLTFNKQFKHNQRKQTWLEEVCNHDRNHENFRAPFSLFHPVSLTHQPPTSSFVHCLHNTVKTLFVITYRYTLIPSTSHRKLISSLSLDILDVINFLYVVSFCTIVKQFNFPRKRKHELNKLFIDQSTFSRLSKRVYHHCLLGTLRDTQMYFLTWH